MIETIHTPVDLKKVEEKDLSLLCAEIREYIVEVTKENGGHLASNLGAVELTIAEHRIFNSPTDHIIFDVGHQSYTHKILTGRYQSFRTIRKFKGLSGFPKTQESIHDAFNTGHSSTSISAALGLASARDLAGETFDIIANIGDGALTGGIALEALNHIGFVNNKIIIVLNDNEMSISPPVGAISKQLTKISSGSTYRNMKYKITVILVKTALGRRLRRALSRVKSIIKHIFSSRGSFFEHFGLTYLGPYDGHDIIGLEEAFRLSKRTDKPTIVHVITKKGKGDWEAESDPEKYHGVAPVGNKKIKSLTNIFGEHLVELAIKHEKITGITAAMCTGTGLNLFRERIPERFFDVSIAEQHGLTFAAGQAMGGYHPFISIYATFMQRGVDQVIHDIAMQNLPVTMILDRAGLVGEDGETHHGVFDISLFGNIPNLIFMEPKNGCELKKMMDFAYSYPGPSMIRFPKAASLDEEIDMASIELGFMEEVIKLDQSEIVIVALGSEMEMALELAKSLGNSSHKVDVYNARFISPISDATIALLEQYKHIITLENHVVHGGFGSLLKSRLNQGKVHSFGLPNEFISHGTIKELREEAGYTLKEVLAAVKENLGV